MQASVPSQLVPRQGRRSGTGHTCLLDMGQYGAQLAQLALEKVQQAVYPPVLGMGCQALGCAMSERVEHDLDPVMAGVIAAFVFGFAIIAYIAFSTGADIKPTASLVIWSVVVAAGIGWYHHVVGQHAYDPIASPIYFTVFLFLTWPLSWPFANSIAENMGRSDSWLNRQLSTTPTYSMKDVLPDLQSPWWDSTWLQWGVEVAVVGLLVYLFFRRAQRR